MNRQEFDSIIKYATSMARHENSTMSYRRAFATIKKHLLREAVQEVSEAQREYRSLLDSSIQESFKFVNAFNIQFPSFFLYEFPHGAQQRYIQALEKKSGIENVKFDVNFFPQDGNWFENPEQAYADLYFQLNSKLRNDFGFDGPYYSTSLQRLGSFAFEEDEDEDEKVNDEFMEKIAKFADVKMAS
jgi:hypothetical protein